MDPNLITALMLISAKTQDAQTRAAIQNYINTQGKVVAPILMTTVEPQLQQQGMSITGRTSAPQSAQSPPAMPASASPMAGPAPRAAPSNPVPGQAGMPSTGTINTYAPAGSGDPNTDPYAPAQAGAQGGMPSASDIQSAVNSVLPPTGAQNNGITSPLGSGQSAAAQSLGSVANPAGSGNGLDPGREQNRTSGSQAPGTGLPVTPPMTPSANGSALPAANTGGGMSVGQASSGSAVGQGGYGLAMGGDQTALSAVLTRVLGNLGIDVTRPGLFTKGIVNEVSPYLSTFMKYYGMGTDGKPALDRAQQAATDFQNIIGGDGSFGKIQDFGRTALGNIGGFINGQGQDPTRQMALVNDLTGLLTAGNNGISQDATQQALKANQIDYGNASLDNSNLRYADFLKGSAASNPQLAMLAQLFR